MPPAITVGRLKELFSYDPESGLFTRLKKTAQCTRVGAVLHPKPGGSGYVEVGIDWRQYLAHRLAWLYMVGEWPAVVDHINGVRHDNRWANLRSVTSKVNRQNQRKANASGSTGLIGAHRARNAFRSSITASGKSVRLGFFRTAEEAHAAYVAAKRRLHEGCTI